MSALAEVIVEEWLNRQEYFTIRGLKVGVHEIDLLAVKVSKQGTLECRHLEVQASAHPVSYISRVPKEIQRATGKAANSAKRNEGEIEQGVKEWIQKKYLEPRKIQAMHRLGPGPWTKELVVHKVKSADELRMIQSHGIKIHHLSQIVAYLTNGHHFIKSASGGDLLELVHIGSLIGERNEVGDSIEGAVYDPRARVEDLP